MKSLIVLLLLAGCAQCRPHVEPILKEADTYLGQVDGAVVGIKCVIP